MHITKIYGPPGTGKTTTLLDILDTEINSGVDPERIAYLTHTNAASDVVVERIKMKKPTWFRTIHSACSKSIGLSRENIVDSSDYRNFETVTGMRIIGEREDGLIEDGGYYASNNFAPALRAYDFARLTGKKFDDVIHLFPPHESLAVMRRECFVAAWTKFKEDRSLFDFTDMLEKYVNSGIGPVNCDTFIVDEAQDLSKLQWDALYKMCGNAKRLYLAGDDDQAIYTFMGGSEFGFLNAEADETKMLSKSYRVPRTIGRRATDLIQNVSNRQKKDVSWRDTKGDIFHVNLDVTQLPWKQWISNKQEVLVLSRHRQGAYQVSAELQSISVPHSLGGYSSHNSLLAQNVRDFILMRSGVSVLWRRVVKLLNTLNRSEQAGDLKARGALNRALMVSRKDVQFPWDSQDWHHFFADSRHELDKVRNIEELIKREGVEVVGSEPIVSVMTMHAAKGREAEIVVILPDCNEIVLKNEWTPGEIRLAYVSLTRAKQKVFILSPRSNRWIGHFMRV